MNPLRANWAVRSVGLALVLSGAMGAPLSAQNATIDWFTIDGGGADSGGGPYKINATVGQQDAGLLMTGSLVIEGGFWPGAFMVSTPRLYIVRSGANVVITWAPEASGYVLQRNDGLSPANWTDAPSGGLNPVTEQVQSETRYYRLVRR
jgi:hypothetical protein